MLFNNGIDVKKKKEKKRKDKFFSLMSTRQWSSLNIVKVKIREGVSLKKNCGEFLQ